MGTLREKVTRNIGILRRELSGKRSRSLVESVVEEAVLHEYEKPTITRSEFARLITDEELAWTEYSRFAENPAIKQNEGARSTVLGMADDERRHAQQLKDIRTLLEREGKIV